MVWGERGGVARRVGRKKRGCEEEVGKINIYSQFTASVREL